MTPRSGPATSPTPASRWSSPRISPGRELGLGVDTGLRALWEAEQPFEFVLASPSGAFLTYLNEGPNTAFDADLEVVSRHVDDDIDAILDEDVPLPDDEEVTGEGYTVRYDAELGFELFPEAPSSYGVRFIGSNIDYTDDTSGTPQWVAEGQAFWQLRLNPVLSSEVRGSYLGYQADDAADTKIRVAQVDFRLIYERSENLTLGAAVGYADREREEFGETIQSDQGPVLSGDVRYELARLHPHRRRRGDRRRPRHSGELHRPRGLRARPRYYLRPRLQPLHRRRHRRGHQHR